MYLKQLELVGFKSFPTRTRLRFEPGITAIVGPNGAGKSNLADAVRWALGEQSARALRGRRGEDVIFAGGGTRHPVGMAEVTLLLDNAEGRFPLPYAEVALTRRLYRSGEGEYLVNGSRVRLRDLTDWLLSVGLGPDSYCVVGQGTVEQLVLQRPEERRLLLEDAADVRRHALRLAEAEAKLATTAANLERARDLARALAPEVERLRQAAERATARARCVARAAALARAYYSRALATATAHVAESRQALAAATAQRAALERALAEVEAARTADETARRAREIHLAALREQVARARAERDRLLREQAVGRERLTAAQARLAERRAAASALETRAAAAAAESTHLAASAAAVRARLTELEAAARSAAASASDADRALAAAQRDRAAAADALEASRSARQRLEQRWQLVTSHQKASAPVVARLRQRGEQAREAVSRAEAQVQACEQAVAAATAQRAEREAALAAATRAREDAECALATARREAEAARTRCEDVRTRRRALEHVLASVPEMVATAALEVAGQRQLLGALLQVEAVHQRAIAAALDIAARYIVVERRESALAGLQLLAARDTPRVVFAVITEADRRQERAAARFRTQAATALADVSGWRLALDLVRVDPIYRALCIRYLGTTLVVDTLATALRVYDRLLQWPERVADFQVVTHDGLVIRSAGEWVVGRDGHETPLLAYRREAQALDAEWRAAQAALNQAQERLTAVDAAAARARADETAARTALAASEAARREAEQAQRFAVQELARVREEARRLAAELAEAEQAQQALGAERAQLEEALVAAREAEAAQQAALMQAAAVLATAERAAQEARARQAALQADLAAVQADERAARELAARAAAEAQRLAAEQQALRDQIQADERAAAEMAAQVERTERRLATVRAALGPREAELRRLEEAAAAAAEERARLDETARRLQRELRAADESCARATLAAERAADELAALERERAAVWAELGLPVEEGDAAAEQDIRERADATHQLEREARAVDAFGPDEAPEAETLAALPAEELRRRLAACQRELRAIGAVDAAALDDYQAVLERQRFIEGQIADLERASAALRSGIAELQARMRHRFQECFAAVNAAFGDCFRTLFGGGTARLALTGDDVLAAGVEVVAQPPGKRAHSLYTLSGGERALTAVALLFALLRVQPSPFCVLDEVDAALDEANIQRFTQLLRAQAAQTQFLIITHNRGTMEAADALYGVTMVDSAVSQVVSLRLTDLPAGGGVVH
ncbi:MAG TPA: chromosome segregation protein SMC [Chloroflexota bacterium]|nr:chromosome segregation protein SMC [Chloroflexota bacterium]